MLVSCVRVASGTEARIKRTNRRHLLLLSDALLIGEPPVPAQGKKAGPKDKITVKQVMMAMTAVDCVRARQLRFIVLGGCRWWSCSTRRCMTARLLSH